MSVVLVTGAAGFIGANIIKGLNADAHRHGGLRYGVYVRIRVCPGARALGVTDRRGDWQHKRWEW